MPPSFCSILRTLRTRWYQREACVASENDLYIRRWGLNHVAQAPDAGAARQNEAVVLRQVL